MFIGLQAFLREYLMRPITLEDIDDFLFDDLELPDFLVKQLRQMPVVEQGGMTGMTRTDIRDLFKRHKGKDEINRALELLFKKGYIQREFQQTDGRPVQIFLRCASATKAT